MLFALQTTDEGRLILTDDHEGETLAVIEASSWREARAQVWRRRELDPFDYVSGHGWFEREAE